MSSCLNVPRQVAVEVKLASQDTTGQDYMDIAMPYLQTHANDIARSRARSGYWLAALLLLLWLAWPALTLRAATFTATLDRDSISTGESATLTLKFEGGNPQAIPNIPPIENLQIQPGASGQYTTIFNGQLSSSVSQEFLLTPTQPGEYVIPALRAQVGGQTVISQPLRLKVVKGAVATGPESEAFFKIVVPKKEVFIGEAIPVEFQVFIRDSMGGESILAQFDGYSGCPLRAEGVTILKTAHLARRHSQVGNFGYNVATLVSAVSPVKAGTLTIGGMELPLTLQIPKGPPSFFRQYEQRQITLAAEPQTITALPVPRTNVPPFFTGAVGNYTMTVSAGPTNVAAGDPVTVKVQISGRGAFDSLALPEQTGWRDFKTYPPTSKVDTTDALGLQGTKIFEQVIVPQNMDIKEVPPVNFSFFNPDKKAYQTLTRPGIPLIVRPGGSSPAPVIATGTPGMTDNPPTSADIIHIKPRMGAIAQINLPLLQQRWFVALQAVPILLWISALIWRRRTESLANNPRLRRQRHVAQLVRNGLAELRAQAAANNSDAFFATLVRLLQEQLGERLDLPASAITEAVIDERLRPRGVSETLLTSLHELFQLCNLVRYAPIKTSQELAAVIPRLESVLRDLQDLKV